MFSNTKFDHRTSNKNFFKQTNQRKLAILFSELKSKDSAINENSTPTSFDAFISKKTASKRYVLNPETKRRIQMSLQKTSRWYDFMYQKGGYIAYRHHLIPIDSKKLLGFVALAETEEILNRRELVDPNHYEEWFLIKPEEVKSIPMNDADKQYEKISRMHLEEQLSNLLFVDKPTDLLTVPGKTEADCLSSRVVSTYLSNYPIRQNKQPPITKQSKMKAKKYTKRKKQMNDEPFLPKPCHRLDRDTSGIVIFGLTAEAHRDVSIQFQNRETSKVYVALVAGILEHDTGIIDLPIGKQPPKPSSTNSSSSAELNDKKEQPAYSTWAIHGEIKPREAITKYEVSQRFPDHGYTRVVLYPKTGRGHQLRLHMKAIGHPILGDTLHAPDSVARATPRLCLHAYMLELSVAGTRIKSVSIPPF